MIKLLIKWLVSISVGSCLCDYRTTNRRNLRRVLLFVSSECSHVKQLRQVVRKRQKKPAPLLEFSFYVSYLFTTHHRDSLHHFVSIIIRYRYSFLHSSSPPMPAALPISSSDLNSPAPLPAEILQPMVLKEEDDDVEKEIPIVTLTPVKTEVEFQECVTPKSEDQMLKPSLVCPKGPIKRARPTQIRKFRQNNFIPVPHDLESVFRALPFSLPKRRKIAQA